MCVYSYSHVHEQLTFDSSQDCLIEEFPPHRLCAVGSCQLLLRKKDIQQFLGKCARVLREAAINVLKQGNSCFRRQWQNDMLLRLWIPTDHLCIIEQLYNNMLMVSKNIVVYYYYMYKYTVIQFNAYLISLSSPALDQHCSFPPYYHQ